MAHCWHVMQSVLELKISSAPVQIVELAPEAVAPDAVQAVSCLIEALHLFTLHGSSFLYEASVATILDVLMRLSQSGAYLAIIAGDCCFDVRCRPALTEDGWYKRLPRVFAGVMEIHRDGVTLFQSLRRMIKDADTKAQAAALGLKIFPDGAEEQSTMVRMHAACLFTHACMHL